MADLMPKDLLPTGNLLCGIAFSIGSLAGPSMGGLFIEFSGGLSFLLLIAGILLFISVLIALKSDAKKALAV